MRVVYHASCNHWPLGEVSCQLVGFLFFLNLYCSMYFMTCTSLDRLLAIVLPLQCQNLRKATNVNAIPWVLMTASMAPVLFTSQTVTIQSPERNVTVCHQLYLEKTSHKALVSTAVTIAIPLVFLTISYILILHKLRMMIFHENSCPAESIWSNPYLTSPLIVRSMFQSRCSNPCLQSLVHSVSYITVLHIIMAHKAPVCMCSTA
ncbi:hypothetical protein SRHO_G00010750 [Serrasalmus rhombeus]